MFVYIRVLYRTEYVCIYYCISSGSSNPRPRQVFFLLFSFFLFYRMDCIFAYWYIRSGSSRPRARQVFFFFFFRRTYFICLRARQLCFFRYFLLFFSQGEAHVLTPCLVLRIIFRSFENFGFCFLKNL